MDGLLPLVFRSLKKTKTRRHYESLSAINNKDETFSFAHDFYKEVSHQPPPYEERSRYTEFREEHGYVHQYRRNKSLGELPRKLGGDGLPPRLSKNGPGFRSHRRMFSCTTGDACRNSGLLILMAGKGNVVRLVPPLTISEKELEHAVEILSECWPALVKE